MKKTILLSGCLILAKIIFASAPPDSIPVPEFINLVYHYDKANNKLADLEKANAEMIIKKKIVGGGSQAYSIEGNKSPVRLNETAQSFMITVTGGVMSADPTSTLTLYKLESNKKNREAAMTAYGGMSNGKGANKTVELKFKKIREGTYEMVVAGKLEKGEYGFVNMNAMSPGGKVTLFAFGID